MMIYFWFFCLTIIKILFRIWEWEWRSERERELERSTDKQLTLHELILFSRSVKSLKKKDLWRILLFFFSFSHCAPSSHSHIVHRILINHQLVNSHPCLIYWLARICFSIIACVPSPLHCWAYGVMQWAHSLLYGLNFSWLCTLPNRENIKFIFQLLSVDDTRFLSQESAMKWSRKCKLNQVNKFAVWWWRISSFKLYDCFCWGFFLVYW